MSRRSRLGIVPLLARTVAPQASVTLLVALLTLVAALIAAGVPRALDTLDEADLSHSLDSISQPQRDVGGGIVPFLVGPAPDKEVAKLPDPAFGRVQSALAAARATVPTALRSALGAPQIVASTHAQPASLAPAPATPAAWNDAVALIADPAYASRIALVSGALPQAWTVPDTTIATGFGDEPAPDPASAAPIDMVVTTGTATTMGLHVGDVLSTAFSQTEVRVRISGIVHALDPSADFWQNTPGVLTPGRVYDGNASPDLTYTATGFVAPGTVLPLSGFAVLNGAFWFPVDGAQVTAAHARAVVDAVHGLQATQIPIADTIAGDQTGTVRVPVQTGLADAVEQSLGRVSALLAILAVLVSGPLGVVVAVFALAVRAVLERRGAVLSLAAARGASPLQLRSVAAVEGLLAGVPAAVVGALVAAIVLPGPDAAAWVVPTLIGLVPAALFASFGTGRGFRTRRRDLSARARGSARWIVEACVLGGAAVTTWLLLRRGPIADSGFDALLALTPLLLALAVAVVVLRLLPIALRAALAVGRRGRGPVAFLGAARAMRDPALGVAAALAVVVGVSV